MAFRATFTPDKTYDIQGQVPTEGQDKVTYLPQGNQSDDASSYDAFDNPAGSGPDVIPATAPGLRQPVVPGQALTDAQKADRNPPMDNPLTNALAANAAFVKSSGLVTVSEDDVQKQNEGKGVLNVAGSSLLNQ